jgi:hypothetical protein
MTILGEIVDLNYARNHPRFGSTTNWDDHASEISHQLVSFGQTLLELRNRAVVEVNAEALEPVNAGTPSARSVTSTISRAQESLMHAKIVEAYGTHLMHTLHILLNGKWDPLSLLDDNDLWISSQSFVDATGHAVSAAEALNVSCHSSLAYIFFREASYCYSSQTSCKGRQTQTSYGPVK